MKTNSRKLPFVLLVVLCLGVFAFGQEQFGNIEGFVKDHSGAVVPNVSVTVTSSAASSTAGFKRTVNTIQMGTLDFYKYPPEYIQFRLAQPAVLRLQHTIMCKLCSVKLHL
ncbi:MAG: carboxypeptidase-like regulatory domain-containing protein [Pyrinomonadaceae bacterium]